MPKTLPILSEAAKELFTFATDGNYESHLKQLLTDAENEVKAESPNLSLQEQLAASRIRFATKHKELKAELRKFVSAL